MSRTPHLLLFDIDGTLLRARGIPKQTFLKLIRRYHPHFDKGEDVNFSGMTDRAIMKAIFRVNGDGQMLSESYIDQLLEEFVVELEFALWQAEAPLVLPGVPALLQKIAGAGHIRQALVTGNVAGGARIKLQRTGLYHFFATGAFGGEYEDRNLLPPIAVRRAENYFQCHFDPQKTWIIGDSPADLYCARAGGLRCLLVGTGWHQKDELLALDPDAWLDNLGDLPEVSRILELEF